MRRDDRASLKRTSPQPGIGLRRVLEGEVLGVSLDLAGACKLENLPKLDDAASVGRRQAAVEGQPACDERQGAAAEADDLDGAASAGRGRR